MKSLLTKMLIPLVAIGSLGIGASAAFAFSEHDAGDMKAHDAKATNLKYHFDAVYEKRGNTKYYGVKWKGTLSAPKGVTAEVKLRSDAYPWVSAAYLKPTATTRSVKFTKNMFPGDTLYLSTSSIQLCHYDYWWILDDCQTAKYKRG
ncbi:MAG: hypothetical protein LBR58_03645 [Propionibacteriaceae bacterium]|nr:hypothetical protein [Propionibacteriaceae bacterium]